MNDTVHQMRIIRISTSCSFRERMLLITFSGQYSLFPNHARDRWGLLMRRDHPLATKQAIKPENLQGIPLIASRQSLAHNELSGQLGKQYESLYIVSTYNLLYNASLMVEENVGCALCLDNIIPKYENSPLCFRPLEPHITVGLDIV